MWSVFESLWGSLYLQWVTQALSLLFPDGGVYLNCPQAINSSAASSVNAEYEACHLPAAECQRRQENIFTKKTVMNPEAPCAIDAKCQDNTG